MRIEIGLFRICSQTWHQGVVDLSQFKIVFNNSCSDMLVNYDGVEYILQSLDFHSPSEHTIGGGYYSGEVQFVHRSSSGGSLIISVLLQEKETAISGTSNDFLATIFALSGGTASGLSNYVSISSNTGINPYTSFTPAQPSQYYYIGSSTTPNCSPSVIYFIFEHPVNVASSDISLLRSAVATLSLNHLSTDGGNNRPLQALGTRIVVRLPGGEVTTSIPTAAPTFTTQAPVIATAGAMRKRLRRPRPDTALLIGAVALGVSVLLIFIFSVFLYNLCLVAKSNQQTTHEQEQHPNDHIELIQKKNKKDLFTYDGNNEDDDDDQDEDLTDNWSTSMTPATIPTNATPVVTNTKISPIGKPSTKRNSARVSARELQS